MATFGVFIGIDRSQHPDYEELTGAKQDARALWALFNDNIPDIQSELITDTEATSEKIRYLLYQTLGSAGPDDTVIVFFAGHGTHDHRLVTYNAVKDSLADTTIPMEELATNFEKSGAGRILLVLDCCFSGAAPARVIGDVAVSRSGGDKPSYDIFKGKGRALLAACKIDERAYEIPGGGHGLLTKAIIDVFSSLNEAKGIGVVMDQIMEKVRIQAARMGVSQTPTLVDYIEGGMMLPPLKPGKKYLTEFPKNQKIKIGPNIQELNAFSFPSKVLGEWGQRFKDGLNNLQLEAVNDSRILDGTSLLVVAPTSSGKTFIGEMASVKAIIAGRKAVFLLPYRALVNEKYDQFSTLYGDNLGMRVVRCTGDYQDQESSFIRGKYDLAILTYEMFLNLVLSSPSVLNQIGLVVLDEAQFITDPSRGITVELILTYLLAARERDIHPQIITLSAVIGDVNSFDAWIGLNKLITTQRPVPLKEGVFNRNGIFKFLDPQGKVETTQLIPSGEIVIRGKEKKSQDMIVPLVRHLVQLGEKVIVFRNQRGNAQGCAAYLAKELKLEPALEAIQQLPNHDLSSISATLRECLSGGTAFHSTNLMREERIAVEKDFRDPKSNIRVLVATTTLAAGINTPASTVVLAEQEFLGEEGRAFTVAEYKNMAGRAGRLGFNEEGKSIILADDSYQVDQLFQKYVKGTPDKLKSSFDPKHINTWIIRLFAQVPHVRRKDVTRLLANTYGGYLAIKADPGWRDNMEKQLDTLLTRMIQLDLVEQDGENLKLTLLGRACGRSSLSFESALRFVEFLKQLNPDSITPEKLIALIQILPESDNGYTPMMKRGRAESVRPSQAAEKYGSDTIRYLQKNIKDEFDYFARCKRASLLWDWINGVSLEEIEKKYTPNFMQGRINHGDVVKFADAARFHMRSAQQILSVMLIDKAPSAESIDILLKQLEYGIPKGAVGLLELPLFLNRGQYLALSQLGAKNKEDVWALSEKSLIDAVGEPKTNEIIELKKEEMI